MPNKNSNWVEKKDGWHKVNEDGNGVKGNSPFDKPIPPMRTGDGLPLRGDGSGRVDWVRAAEEIENGTLKRK